MHTYFHYLCPGIEEAGSSGSNPGEEGQSGPAGSRKFYQPGCLGRWPEFNKLIGDYIGNGVVINVLVIKCRPAH